MSWGATNVTVRFDDRLVLDGVSLDAEPGTVTAVVGGDGAGKSTLLRVLVGLVRPDRGVVRRPPRQNLGYFSAACGVYDDLSVAENLSFVATAQRAHNRPRLAQLLDAAGLTQVSGRLAGQLSGGMRQKLGLVMAMLHNPTLLVLDEPSTGVDPVSRTELSRLITRAAAAGSSVVMSTAYLDEAERANSVLVLDAGRALRSGVPEDIVAALPGAVVWSPVRPQEDTAWRRGGGWHQWLPPGVVVPPGTRPAKIDLEDAVIVAALERSSR